jgi:hypothetical protein
MSTIVEVTPPVMPGLMSSDEFLKQQRAEQELDTKKLRSNVKVFEKMNVGDRRPWGQQNPVGAGQYICGLRQEQATEYLRKRIEEDGPKKFAGPAGPAKLLFSRIWSGSFKATNGQTYSDGWLYSEAYYESQDVNLTIRSIVMADGTCFGY